MRRRATALVAAMLFVFAGCGGEDGGDGGNVLEDRPTSTATIDIVAPEAGAVIEGDTVEVKLDLQGGTIAETARRTNIVPDEGHIHLMLDGRVVSQTFGITEEIEVEPGRHLLEAEYVAVDHNPFDPRVLDTITFEVAE